MSEFEKAQCTCAHGYTCRAMKDPNCCAHSCDYNDVADALSKATSERDAALAQNAELVAQRNELLSLIYNSAIGQVCMNCHVDAESLARSAFEITGIDANQIRDWEK